jgi:hypothetical protein
MGNKKEPAEKYLAKAAQAEEIASTFAEGFLKESWLTIARGYRELAEAEQANVPSLAQPTS